MAVRALFFFQTFTTQHVLSKNVYIFSTMVIVVVCVVDVATLLTCHVPVLKTPSVAVEDMVIAGASVRAKVPPTERLVLPLSQVKQNLAEVRRPFVSSPLPLSYLVGVALPAAGFTAVAAWAVVSGWQCWYRQFFLVEKRACLYQNHCTGSGRWVRICHAAAHQQIMLTLYVKGVLS